MKAGGYSLEITQVYVIQTLHMNITRLVLCNGYVPLMKGLNNILYVEDLKKAMN